MDIEEIADLTRFEEKEGDVRSDDADEGRDEQYESENNTQEKNQESGPTTGAGCEIDVHGQ
jgi:major membrane immunogen (membrane-anchored lipoprotein)